MDDDLSAWDSPSFDSSSGATGRLSLLLLLLLLPLITITGLAAAKAGIGSAGSTFGRGRDGRPDGSPGVDIPRE